MMKNFYIGKYGIQQDNDCSVLALCDYFEIPYKQARAIAISNRLTDAGMTTENFLLAVWELSGRQPRIAKPDIITTVAEAAQRLDSGFIVTDGNHIMQCSGFSAGNCKGYEDKHVKLLIYV